MYGAWLLAAGSVAVTLAVIVTESFVVLGFVDRSSGAYGSSIGVVTAVVFAVLAAVPFVFRKRFVVSDGEKADTP
jgi:hypothetical protein